MPEPASAATSRPECLQSCRELVGRLLPEGPAAELFTTQIERVVARLTAGEAAPRLGTPGEVVRVLRTNRCLPAVLLDRVRDHLSTAAAVSTSQNATEIEALGACFAASFFPQRAGASASELERCWLAFIEVWSRLRTVPASPVDGDDPLGLRSLGRLSGLLRGEELESLLHDLGGCEGSPDTSARRAGALLCLAVSPADRMARIHEKWLLEKTFWRDFMRFLRESPLSPPSACAPARDNDLPSWDAVKASLSQRFTADPEFGDRMCMLEQSLWKQARKAQCEDPASAVRKGWSELAERLGSGFPYYGFRSRFGRWWKVAVTRVDFEQRRPGQLPPPAPVAEIGEEQVRVLREGYRLIRTTFFAMRHDVAMKPLADVNEVAVTEAHERQRRALDQLWVSRLESRMDGRVPSGTMQAIRERFPDVSASTLNMMNHRLRLRVWAYALSRVRGMSNGEILSARRPSRGAAGTRPEVPATSDTGRRNQRREFPLRGEPGVLPVASLARIARPDQTLLWAFIAYLWLRPMADAAHADSVTAQGYLRELWSWLTNDGFDDALESGSRRNNPADRAAMTLAREPRWTTLRSHLQSLHSTESLPPALVAQWQQVSPEVLPLIDRLVAGGRANLPTAADAQAWKDFAGLHWVAPVWYLSAVERLNLERVLVRLNVDQPERVRIGGLYRRIAATLAPAPGASRDRG